MFGSVYAKFRNLGRLLPSCIRKNPGARGGFGSVAYTVYAKIQESSGGFCAVAYTQKSRSSGRHLLCSVYAKFRIPGRALSSSVYAKIQELEQASVLQRIRKNTEAQAGFCPAAYTQNSRNPSRLLSSSVYAKIPKPRQGPVAYTCANQHPSQRNREERISYPVSYGENQCRYEILFGTQRDNRIFFGSAARGDNAGEKCQRHTDENENHRNRGRKISVQRADAGKVMQNHVHRNA